MLTLPKLRALGALDAASLLADPMLRWMALLPLVVAAAIRLVLPALLVKLSELSGMALDWMGPQLAGYVLVGLGPLLAGCVVGFLLLDQRDDRTLLALRVTPLPLGVYLAYRLAAPVLIALPITLAAVAVAGGVGLGIGATLLAALASAPLAPVVALGLAAFARNKVQGLALMKASSALLMLPLASLFLPPAWHTPLFAVPTFLAARAVWALQAGTAAWPWISGSWLLGATLCALFLLRLRRNLM